MMQLQVAEHLLPALARHGSAAPAAGGAVTARETRMRPASAGAPSGSGELLALLPLTNRALRVAPWRVRDRNDFRAAGQGAASGDQYLKNASGIHSTGNWSSKAGASDQSPVSISR